MMELEVDTRPLDWWNAKPREPLANKRYHSEHLLEAQELLRLPFTSSTFGGLPPEVRELIYEFAMTMEPPGWGEKPCWLKHVESAQSDLQVTLPSSARSPGRTARPGLALLFTCRQIYREARYLYYTPDFFSFKKAESMVGLLLESGWADRHELQSMRIFLYGGGYFGTGSYQEGRALWYAISKLSHCKFLRKLEIVIEGAWHNKTNLASDFILPFKGLTDVEVCVRSMIRCYDSDENSYHDDLEEEEHDWILIRSDNGAYFQSNDAEGDAIYRGIRRFIHLRVPFRRWPGVIYGGKMYFGGFGRRDWNEQYYIR